ncbi:Protein MEMO1 [Erysiphe neolycopersici]|uniref:Protein MEMO1 n=1 Tax=Erysiphe neolycopersici TaxID=212602 RepID=A0A420I066_9PEZI|nr:Protein MEMO1 [Erysiphe neolycopersici]
MTIRPASHAGSWYSSCPNVLSTEIDNWLSQTRTSTNDVTESVPVSNARIIIAPHAGYAYSGPAAAYAYASLSVTPSTRRIFLLGPSHTLYLTKCALSTHSYYETPIGNLPIDNSTVAALRTTGKFDIMTPETDEKEHSLEMHLPYIQKLVSRVFKSPENYPSIVPILVGNTSASAEREYGRILAPYLADPTNLFVISSDFCHWGLRFGYTYYLPEGMDETQGYDLDRSDPNPKLPLIHESIARLDKLAISAIESGSHSAFLENLKNTGNTVCGRHPIGVALAALEVLEKSSERENLPSLSRTASDSNHTLNQNRKFKFLRYERSSDVVDVLDSSVSYASAYATI